MLVTSGIRAVHSNHEWTKINTVVDSEQFETLPQVSSNGVVCPFEKHKGTFIMRVSRYAMTTPHGVEWS